jgi:HSP20 family protein
MPWTPPADVIETDRDIRIEVDLAGVPKDDVNVSFDENVLWVRGKRTTTNGGAIRHSERRSGAFQRGFVLPPRARKDRIDAHFRDGVLIVQVPVEEREAAEV